MNAWYECKIKYRKTDENGKDKLVSESYLIDALSFTEAEQRTHEELSQYISGDFRITTIKPANFSEIVPVENSDRWFKAKLSLISFDEEKAQEKRSNSYILVQANNVKEAYENIFEYMSGTTSDFEVPAISESNILDVFPYNGSTEEIHEELNNTPENQKSSIDDSDDIESEEDIF